jgi:hypothetical protein
MARMSLGEMINAALSSADSSLKLASARDADPVDPGDYLAEELAWSKSAADEPEKQEAPTEKKDEKKREDKDEKSEKKSSREILDNAAYGMKLAEALEVGAHYVYKLATSPLDAPGPAVQESGFISAKTTVPKASSTVTDKITGPSTDASSLATTISDHTGNLDGQQPPNNTGKTAGFTRDKQASERMLRAMQKQAEVLARMGQVSSAQKMASAIHKLAQDPSSPQPEGLPAHSDSFRLSTEPGESSHIPENAGLISMTKAQAKDRSVRTVTQHISETPGTDNAVAAHTLTTHGQKVSSLVVKLAEEKREIPREWDEKYQGRVGAGLLGVTGGAYGASGGAILGDSLGGNRGALIGAALGGAIGATGGGIGGYHLGRWGAREARKDEEAKARILEAAKHK